MAATTRTRAARRDQARDALLAAVEELLREGTSFTSIKIDELATRAGMSRATFYIHFQDKVEVLEQWLLDTRDAILRAANAWYSADPAIDHPALRDAIEQITLAYRPRSLLMLAARETAFYDSALRQDFADAFEAHVTRLTDHIEAGQQAGIIDADLHARAAAEWLVCMIDRVPTCIPADATKAQLRAHIDTATDIVWAALYTRAD